MVLCILFEVTNIHLSQYKQNKSDSNSNNDGDNGKNNKNDDGNKIMIIIIVVWLFGSKRAVIAGMVDGMSS